MSATTPTFTPSYRQLLTEDPHIHSQLPTATDRGPPHPLPATDSILGTAYVFLKFEVPKI